MAAESKSNKRDEASGPLAGIRVLDLTRLLPGPVASLHLADMGAEVIKIEDTGAGDYARTMGPRPAGDKRGDSLFFRMINRNKKSLRLDLKQAAGVEVFLRLVRNADIILESFRPGVVDKLGIGFDAARAINPRIVYASISGYGQTGPWADKAAHDLNFIAMSGLLDQIGTADDGISGPPAIPNLQIGDLLGGALTPLVGVLAAVIAAKTTGNGSHVDISMTDAVFAHTIFPFQASLLQGKPSPRGQDFLTGGVPCYAVYRTADDRYLAVGALEPKFWQLLCATIQRPDLAPFGLAMGEKGKSVRQALAELFGAQPLSHWSALFAEVDCCVTPVLRSDEAMAHPQLRSRGMVREVAGVSQLGSPFKFSAWQEGDSQASPEVGQHNAEILGTAGYSEEEVTRLQQARVI